MLELISIILILGRTVLVFRGSPYFGLFGVLVQSLGFSFLLFLLGLPFFSLLIVLVYVGGMMVVFLFSTILSAERYPGSSWREFFIFSFFVFLLLAPNSFRSFYFSFRSSLGSLRPELGYSSVFVDLRVITCLIAFILLVGLVVVLVIGFEHGQSNLRKL